ncbi:MAG: DUF4136 domain-containing protein [Cyclobacteriaceae bacterium]|nr:DUF4136 domain-containing protein [Cyclobacteriaceae bacterium]MDX5467112.1 DUF4136 domain-containing protein [Cyclobacteriaceae bacterium]
MNPIIKNLLILGLFICLTSCTSIEIFKENTEIPIRKTYQSFVIINKELEMNGFSDTYLDELVKSELQAQLEASGMVYDREKPDVVIRYHSNEDPRKRETVNYNPYPFWGYRVYDPWMYNPYNNFNQNRISTSNYELLQVILDFIDPAQDKYLMTLTAVTEVSSPKNKKNKVIKSLQKATDTFISLNKSNPK